MTILQFGIPIVALSLGVATTGMAGKDGGGEVRPPAVAGQFYPESATVLKLAIEKFMEDALPPQVKKPLAIVVPHAGYIYSGQICADGWNQVRGGAYDVVVILGHQPHGARPPEDRPLPGRRLPDAARNRRGGRGSRRRRSWPPRPTAPSTGGRTSGNTRSRSRSPSPRSSSPRPRSSPQSSARRTPPSAPASETHWPRS